MRRISSHTLLASIAAVGVMTSATYALATPSFTLFESGQVRPLALSPDGKLLFATNTPDNRVEVFKVKPYGLKHLGSVTVGLEPVAVAARSDDEIWVVNHLSDSISIVDVTQPHAPRVVRTLLVGDEPRDVLFAGPGHDRAFVTTAHRGQNSPVDPQLTTPGVGRADVWVFDANNVGTSLEGTPVQILTLFSDTPRALAATPDGSTVYAAAFHSGNRTTVASEFTIPIASGVPSLPPPDENFEGIPAPAVGLIVQFNGSHWVDEAGQIWDDLVFFSLPDHDVFVIDAMANPPAQVTGPSGFFSGVGTILYNMAVNPVNGKVYVSNTEAFNLVRFEGPGDFAGSSVQGHLHENRITVLDGTGAHPRHLNKHIDFSSCCDPIPNAENENSLALPQSLAITSDGATLYVAALGSSKIGVFDTTEIETDTFVPSNDDHIPVSGGGPTGIVLDESRARLYVLTRFDNSISIIDTDSRTETHHIAMYNPEPPSIVQGRPLLYDASFSSSHGDSACASCHIFGDFDSLPWDLGNPDSEMIPNPNSTKVSLFPFPVDPTFHPMKGPLTTQSLRGMANHGPMHWRGDRSGGSDSEPNVQPDGGAFNEFEAFLKFNVGFTELLGRGEQIPEADMEAFAEFILQVTYPPNPIRALDNSLTADQQAGRDFFFNRVTDLGVVSCQGCHTLNPNANAEFGVAAPGFFGTDGTQAREGFPQMFKIPHFRNLYQKVGMFGMPPAFNILPIAGLDGFMGDQIRGSGFSRAGDVDTLFRFTNVVTFSATIPGNDDGFDVGPAGDVLRRQVEQFLLAFDSNMAPVVGQQVTLTQDNALVAFPRIDLLIARADTGECDLVVKGRHGSKETGYLYIGAATFLPNKANKPPSLDSALRSKANGHGDELTYTCVPPGSGIRIGLDRDSDGILDGDDEDS